jgi:CheY-like chemotaxis protein/DNA-binding MarR family transcriptional regulator
MNTPCNADEGGRLTFTGAGHIKVQPADARAHVEPAKTRVLVIDDDPTTLELVRSVLESHGYACLTASSGEAALSLLESSTDILLAISDINMPGMDGLSFLKRISPHAMSRPMPRVIFLTAYPRVDFAVAALKLGAIDFLTKPVRPQKLLAAVENAAARVQRERALSQLPDLAAMLAQQAELLASVLKAPAQQQEDVHSPAAGGSPAAWSHRAAGPRDFALLGMDHLRRLRRLFPPLNELDEVAWELLRELMRAEKNAQRLSVSSLSMSAEQVSATTALRRIQELVKAGHIVRNPDPSDARRDFVTLSPEIRTTLEQYLERVAGELAAAAGSSG